MAAKALDLTILLIPCVVVVWYFGDQYKPITGAFLVLVTFVAYDALTTTWWGGTLGKRIVGLRVVQLDAIGNPSLLLSTRRALISSVLCMLSVVVTAFGLLFFLAALVFALPGTAEQDDTVVDIGTIVATAVLTTLAGLAAAAAWGGSVLLDPLGRGVADRAAQTIVSPNRVALPVSSRDLPGYEDGIRPPHLLPIGRVADIDVRARARLRRLTDSRLLTVAIAALALALVLPFATGTILLASSAAWIVVFVADETRLVHRTGATPGHVLAGLQILDPRTGAPPGVGRSFLRALTLALTLYVPLLWPLLLLSVLGAAVGDRGRTLHDVVGRTVVVGDPALDPETQRQRASRVRTGQAG